jgi:hypothetical protein
VGVKAAVEVGHTEGVVTAISFVKEVTPVTVIVGVRVKSVCIDVALTSTDDSIVGDIAIVSFNSGVSEASSTRVPSDPGPLITSVQPTQVVISNIKNKSVILFFRMIAVRRHKGNYSSS